MIYFFSGLRAVGITAGSLLVGTGLAYLLARFNPEYRDTFEKYIPGSKGFFSYTIGPNEKKFSNYSEKPLSRDKNG